MIVINLYRSNPNHKIYINLVIYILDILIIYTNDFSLKNIPLINKLNNISKNIIIFS